MSVMLRERVVFRERENNVRERSSDVYRERIIFREGEYSMCGLSCQSQIFLINTVHISSYTC